MIYIRANHPSAFRSGEWGHLFNIQYDDYGRVIWCIEFPDGQVDALASWDAGYDYQVKYQIEPLPGFEDMGLT